MKLISTSSITTTWKSIKCACMQQDVYIVARRVHSRESFGFYFSFLFFFSFQLRNWSLPDFICILIQHTHAHTHTHTHTCTHTYTHTHTHTAVCQASLEQYCHVRYIHRLAIVYELCGCHVGTSSFIVDISDGWQRVV